MCTKFFVRINQIEVFSVHKSSEQISLCLSVYQSVLLSISFVYLTVLLSISFVYLSVLFLSRLSICLSLENKYLFLVHANSQTNWYIILEKVFLQNFKRPFSTLGLKYRTYGNFIVSFYLMNKFGHISVFMELTLEWKCNKYANKNMNKVLSFI